MDENNIDLEAIWRAQQGESDSDDSMIMICNESADTAYECFSAHPKKK